MADDDVFYGVPEQKKFPLDTRSHVVSAVRFFNYVEPRYERELARSLASKVREYGIELVPSDTNRFYKYYHSKKIDAVIKHSALIYRHARRGGDS